MTSNDGGHVQTIAGRALMAAGALFLLVVTYLFAVLLPRGLTFEMFDDSPALLDWTRDHLGLYLGMYLIYLVQQLFLLGAAALLWRQATSSTSAGGMIAAAAGLISVPMALLSIGQLIMATHSEVELWTRVGTDPIRQEMVLLSFETAVDVAKAARLGSEVLLGFWLLWLGLLLHRSSAGRIPGWLLVAAVGVWTTVVGGWKLLDPLMPYEDWVAFLTGSAQLAAGWGLLRAGASTRSTPS